MPEDANTLMTKLLLEKIDHVRELADERHAARETDKAGIFARLDGLGEQLHENTLAMLAHDKRASAIEQTLAKQQHFFGGIIFCVSSIWAVVVLFKATIIEFFTGSN